MGKPGSQYGMRVEERLALYCSSRSPPVLLNFVTFDNSEIVRDLQKRKFPLSGGGEKIIARIKE